VSDTHSSVNATILRNAASPEVLEAALRANEAAEQPTEDDQAAQTVRRSDGGASRPAMPELLEVPPANMVRANDAEGPNAAPAQEAETTAVAGLSRRNAQAVLHASTALAEAGEDAVRAWLELAQNAMRTNVTALSRLAECRSWPEIMAVQSGALQERIQQSVECGQAVARTSTLALIKAEQALQAAHWEEPRPSP
jgi:hypothetical protein